MLLGVELKGKENLETLIQGLAQTSEIEGSILNMQQVPYSIAIRLGLENIGLQHTDKHVDGIVAIMLYPTQKTNRTQRYLYEVL